MVSTKERQDTLARYRKKRAFFVRERPIWRTAIKDISVAIDALELLVTLNLTEEQKNDKKKGK